ncbi:MAG: hypothetical protein K2X27_22030 [Candidatus Obscuribacterales bacterium]|nr:hypothetical protein [Candidatus Obscuribacterales bacterium]
MGDSRITDGTQSGDQNTSAAERLGASAWDEIAGALSGRALSTPEDFSKLFSGTVRPEDRRRPASAASGNEQDSQKQEQGEPTAPESRLPSAKAHSGSQENEPKPAESKESEIPAAKSGAPHPVSAENNGTDDSNPSEPKPAENKNTHNEKPGVQNDEKPGSENSAPETGVLPEAKAKGNPTTATPEGSLKDLLAAGSGSPDKSGKAKDETGLVKTAPGDAEIPKQGSLAPVITQPQPSTALQHPNKELKDSDPVKVLSNIFGDSRPLPTATKKDPVYKAPEQDAGAPPHGPLPSIIKVGELGSNAIGGVAPGLNNLSKLEPAATVPLPTATAALPALPTDREKAYLQPSLSNASGNPGPQEAALLPTTFKLPNSIDNTNQVQQNLLDDMRRRMSPVNSESGSPEPKDLSSKLPLYPEMRPVQNSLQTILANSLRDTAVELARENKDDKDSKLRMLQNFLELPTATGSRAEQGFQNEQPVRLPQAAQNQLEMQSIRPEDTNKTDSLKSTPDIRQADNSLESKIQPLMTSLSELKALKLSESARPIQDNREQSSSKTELPMLANLVKAADISLMKDLKPAGSPEQIDLNNPNMRLARNQIMAEAVALKDLLGGAKAVEPKTSAEAVSLQTLKDGILVGKFDPSTGKFEAIPGKFDPLTGKFEPISGKLDPLAGKFDPITGKFEPFSGKIDPLTGKLIDGKMDPLTGLKVGEIIDGTKGKNPLADGIAGDKLGTGRKDINDKKEEDDEKTNINKELIGLVAASNKIKDQKKPEEKEDDKNNKKKNEPEVRRKYIVQVGDSLESIAQKMLGDSRLSLLLELVNRGNLRYNWQGALRKVILRVGQTLWLPTSQEVKVHMVLYSSKKTSDENSKAANDSREELIRRTEGRSPQNQEDEEIDLMASLPTVEIAETDESENTRKINSELHGTSLPAESSLEIKAAVTTFIENSTLSVKEIQNLLQNMRYAAELGQRISGAFSQTRELRFAEKNSSEISKQLDASNRIVISIEVLADGEDKFNARLEKLYGFEWKLIGLYESADGRSVRYLHKCNGARKALRLNLDDKIVREMAIKDFSKNWQVYSRAYEEIGLNNKSQIAS